MYRSSLFFGSQDKIFPVRFSAMDRSALTLWLQREDVKKIWMGFLLALAGAAITYLSETVSHVDFGQWTPFVAAGISVAVNALRKIIAGYQEKKNGPA